MTPRTLRRIVGFTSLAAGMLLAGLAHADVTYTPHDDGIHIGTVTLHNHVTPGYPREIMHEIETAHGIVTIRHVITPNISADPRDSIEVWALPRNLVAVPPMVYVEEKHKGEIKLLLWEGM